jgi:hypothetical protein
MTRKFFTLLSILGVITLLIPSKVVTGVLADSGGLRYEVTVTNLARRQVLTPTVVAVHNSDFKPLFEEGHSLEDLADPAARPEVRPLIEEADAGPLLNVLSNDPNVRQVKILQGAQLTGGIIPFPEGRNKVILPGKSASVIIEAGGRERLLSMIGMLGQTNDSFYALRNIELPRNNDTETHYAVAYDGGTEVNNELCAFIPGAPCGSVCSPSSTPEFCDAVRARNGEGFVRISEGNHGVGSLPANLWDWRNPVAKITIRRL